MSCYYCGGRVEWVGKLTNLTHTVCLGCNRTNCQIVFEDSKTPEFEGIKTTVGDEKGGGMILMNLHEVCEAWEEIGLHEKPEWFYYALKPVMRDAPTHKFRIDKIGQIYKFNQGTGHYLFWDRPDAGYIAAGDYYLCDNTGMPKDGTP